MTPEKKASMKNKNNAPKRSDAENFKNSPSVKEGNISDYKDKGVVQRENKPKLVLKFNNVTKRFAVKTAVKNCSITLNKGEVMAVMAPEGHGKSTLAKLAAGLIRPSEGDVLVRGVKAGRETNSIVSYQPDIPYFKYDTTVSELLNMYSRFFKDFSYRKAYQLLKHFDISRRTRFENLSTTALFIVQVIMISSRRASLYIFDDPIVHCDPKYRDDIISMIDKCRKYGGVLLLSQIAGGLDDITDKAVFLKHGEIAGEPYDADSFEAEFGSSLLNDVYKEVFKHA
ncbi:MAG: ATP-binding cassette domain-containing protein [Clostridia bacterium]|nr:ATP-binding cassette domain-containing protein [Clostridia bacterium]